MTQRKVLELAMDRAKELWIFADVKACDAYYNDPALNKLEEKAWKLYEDCCRSYMEELQKIRDQKEDEIMGNYSIGCWEIERYELHLYCDGIDMRVNNFGNEEEAVYYGQNYIKEHPSCKFQVFKIMRACFENV